MKITLFYSLLLLLFSHTAKAQDPVEDSLERLIGRVRAVRTETVAFSFKSGKREKGPRLLSSIEEYDPYGRLAKSISYKPDGSKDFDWLSSTDPNEKKAFVGCSTCEGVTELRIKPQYDDKGKVIRESTYTLEGNLISWTEYKYDVAGNRIEEWEYNNGILLSRNVHSYDLNGNKVLTRRYDSRGKTDRKWEYNYDKERNLIAITGYSSDDSVIGKTRYRYDQSDNVTEKANYDYGDSLSSKANYSYEYDAKGNWINRTTYTVSMLNTFDSSKVIFEGITEIIYRSITYY